MEEEMPDLPVICAVLEDTLDEIDEIEDMTRVSKRTLLLNQRQIIDSLVDLFKYVLAKGYKLDMLDKAVSKVATLSLDKMKIDTEDDKNKKEKDEMSNVFYC